MASMWLKITSAQDMIITKYEYPFKDWYSCWAFSAHA